MIIAIASGKGGTGKTTLTAALARAWPAPPAVADLDVEAPNLHLLLDPILEGRAESRLAVPQADPERCNGCGACARMCQFRAIAVFGTYPSVFPEMCHGCGGCFAVCTTGALSPATRVLGEIRQGQAGDIDFLMGDLRIGEALSPPLIREVQARLRSHLAETGRDALIDCPPGASCPALTAVRPADAIVLVTEPTPFGLNDLKAIRQAVAGMGKPIGVVINRAGIGDGRVRDYCRATALPVLAEIPFDSRITAISEPKAAAAALAEVCGNELGRLVDGIHGLIAAGTQGAAHG